MTTTELSPLMRPHTPPVPLKRLMEAFALTFRGGSEDAAATQMSSLEQLQVTGVSLNSGTVQPGDLYLALPGARVHGARYAVQAREAGAVAVLTDTAGATLLADAGAQQIPVLVADCDPRTIAGRVAALIYGTDEPGVPIFGITGTNGKTSVVYTLAALLDAVGLRPGFSSTAERRVGDVAFESDLTSPEAPELHALIAMMREEEAQSIVVEVSAHAVERHRIDGVHFDVVAFNNFSQDHLDDFSDMESYFQAKLALFAPEHARRGVVVVDDPHGQRIARESEIPVTTLATEYGVTADWHLAVIGQTLDRVSFVLQGPEGAHFRGSIPIPGRFMAENAALALIMLHEAGIGLADVAAALDRGSIPVQIPGRLELISAPGTGPRFYVDYGHTPGSFQAMLDALGELVEGRIIFLFGADGDRDRTKRAEMGRIAAAGSDTVIICDYHPRTEDPAAIRAELLAGARSAAHATVIEEADPRAAVRLAVSLAEPGDVILYAGPGHEDFQEVAGQKLPYSARDEVRGALREAGLL